jgi:hypothetical protein
MAAPQDLPDIPDIPISGGSSLSNLKSVPNSFTLNPQAATAYSRGNYGQYGMYNDLPVLNGQALDNIMGGGNEIFDFSHSRGNLTRDIGWTANSFSNRIARGAAAYDLKLNYRSEEGPVNPETGETTYNTYTIYPDRDKLVTVANSLGIDPKDIDDENLYKAIDEAAKDTYVVTMDSIQPGAASEGGGGSFQTAIYKRQGDALVAVSDPKSHGGWQNADVYTGGSGFNFGKDVLPGLIFVGAFAAGAYGLDTLLASAAASSLGAGTGLTAGTAGGATGLTAGSVGGATGLTAAAGSASGIAATQAAAGLGLSTASSWAATSAALSNAASSFGMGALRGAGISALQDVLTGQDIDFGRAGISALTAGTGSAAGRFASTLAAPYGQFAARAAGAVSGGIAGGATSAGLRGRDVGQGALMGALGGVSNIATTGIQSTAGRIAADAVVGGARTAVRGGDFTEGAIASGTGSAVSAGVNRASQFGADLYKSATAPSYEFGIKAPTTRLGIDTDLSALNVPSSGFSIKPPAEGYTFGELSPALADNYYTPSYDVSSSKAVKRIMDTAKSATSRAITSAILGPSSTQTRTLTSQARSTAPDFVTGGRSSAPDFTGESDPGRVTSDVYSSTYELRKFVSTKTGASTYIPFKDNKPQSPIPQGYKQVEIVGAAKGGLIEGQPSTTMVKYSKKPLLAQRKKEKKIAKKGLASKQ